MAEDRVTILIVDDDPGQAELVRRNLRRAGLQNPMLTIDNGAEGLILAVASLPTWGGLG
jgi:CheY-like chemotaxis protein